MELSSRPLPDQKNPLPSSLSSSLTSALVTTLCEWYAVHHRPLPWRQTQDPYAIWCSEIMLQQTTVTAVVPYYERFLKRFPTLESLATASLPSVYEVWTGLGYYTRARNLHRAAQELWSRSQSPVFPPLTHQELLQLPGFGPYTARAVASFAFHEAVGVLDGNVIRILCRVLGWALPWWESKAKVQLQGASDELVQAGIRAGLDSSLVNQSLIELGATLCTPKNPQCLLCPWRSHCEMKKHMNHSTGNDTQPQLPLSKKRPQPEIWIWEAQILERDSRLLLVKNDGILPFLKGQWIFPGEARREKNKPKTWALEHSITHHKIYVHIHKFFPLEKTKFLPDSFPLKDSSKESLWIRPEEIPRQNPSSLLRKILRGVYNHSLEVHHLEV